MKKEHTAKQDTNQDSILGRDVNAALRELILLSRKLVNFAEDETQALVRGDMMRFACVQAYKESVALKYTKASEEFRCRLEEFRHADKSLIAQLDKLQTELKQKAESNNVMIGSIKKRSIANTKSTLFTVQELGQKMQGIVNKVSSASATRKGAQA